LETTHSATPADVSEFLVVNRCT